MKRVILMAAAAVMAATGVSAQGRAGLPRTGTTQSVSLQIPLGASFHYAYEHPLGRLGTIALRAGADAGAEWGSDWFGGNYFLWVVAPSVDIEPRWYYGLDRRAACGRGTDGNAGSFLALQMKNILPMGLVSGGGTLTGVTALTPMWGMRRVWGDSWLFEFTSGISFASGWEGGSAKSLHLGVRFGRSF